FAAEMLPKSFGMNRSEYFSVLIAPVIIGAMKLLRPLVAAFTAVSRFFSRLFIKDNSTSATYTEEELHDIVNTIADEGTIEPEKSQLIKSALNFSDVLVESIMTPWDKTEKIRKDASFDEVMAVYSKSKHTRFPLVDDEGRPLGLLHIRLFLNSYLQNNIKQNAAEVSSEPFYIDSKTPAEMALREMSESKTNLAFVISRPDEKSTHTETVGIVTVEDILESLVGDISDESDDGGDVL
ncbi:MAG: CBS domain-containing protein, partial [Clostridiales bacterium]|nr:CBS domain-containing protein [Clostridiales bacterium]